MAEIRRATEADADAVVELGRALQAEAPAYQESAFDEPSFRAFLDERMRSTHMVDDSVVLVALVREEVVGTLIAMMFPHWFSRLQMACEVGLYVKPEHRGGRVFPQLVRAFETWAASNGAARVLLGVSTGIHADRTVRAYEGLGYTLDDHRTASKPCSTSP